MVEIYNMSPSSPNYDSTILDISDEIQIYVQQIINLLHGSTGSVMGALDMPIDLEHFVYETGVDSKHIENIILDKLRAYAEIPFNKFPTSVSVKFMNGNVRDICMIDISINNSRRITIKIK